MKFWLGTNMPEWLRMTSVPLMVSRRRLQTRKSFPRALGPWVLDSGGFTELSMLGSWELSPRDYVKMTRRFSQEIGNLVWAAPQDWMCEPFIVAKTGLSVELHQRKTVANYLQLMMIAPDMPWIPVLQGYEAADYLRHVEMYAKLGVYLDNLPLVGVGSVCRRQATSEIVELMTLLWKQCISLHGFGVKKGGMERLAPLLASADSMAWAMRARYEPAMEGHDHHKHCGSCLEYATKWYTEIMLVAA